MCKDDGWFIRHVEPPNACRLSDNPTDRLAIGVCASKYVSIDPVCERVALSARSLQKSSMLDEPLRLIRAHHGRVAQLSCSTPGTGHAETPCGARGMSADGIIASST